MADHPGEPLHAVLRRLKEERDEADARYNEALTALDRTLRPAPALPRPAPPVDDHQLAALNEGWNILPSPPEASGLRGKLTGFIWRVVGPYLQRQLAFNAQLVDHVNRTVAAGRETHRTADAIVSALADERAALGAFQSSLLLYLQQITGYVDTKDRDSAAGALILNESLSGFADVLDKRFESMTSREHRYDARAAALASGQDELRATLAVVQQGFMMVKREMEHVQSVPRDQQTADLPEVGRRGPGGTAPDAFAPALDAYKYVGFEDQFRGSRETILARFESYVPLFHGATDVLDVGCGRGEFLDLLSAAGIGARGLDLNHEMAEVCRARGLDVTEADAVAYLGAVPDGSLGGIFSAQVVEHLQPAYLLRFLELAFHKIRPGGRLVLETLNPACWVAFFESFIRDITHVWPLHPETLKYLVVASGFTKAAIEFRSPVPQQDRLQPVPIPAGADVAFSDLAEAFNGNVEKLNARIFTYLDYAIIGDKSS
jgi:SAM-dependent methyltransferase